MKIAGVCLLALAVIGAQSLTERNVPRPEIGATYLSEYKAYTVSGIPLLNNERTGFAVWTDLLTHIQSESRVVVQLQDPTIRHIFLNSSSNLPVDRIPLLEDALLNTDEFRLLPKNVQELLKEHIEKPVTLSIVDGVIVEVIADKEEPEWILSLKSGIFQHLQVHRVTKTTEKKIEDTIVGRECEINYDVVRPIEDSESMRVTKQWSLDSCVEPIVVDDLLRFANEPRKDSDERRSLRSSFVTVMNVTDEHLPFVFDLVSEGRYTISIFTPNHGEAIVYTRQEMKFLEIVDNTIRTTLRTPTLRRTTITPSTMSHQMETELMTKSEQTLVDLIKSIFTEIVQTTEVAEEPTFNLDITEKFNLAVRLLNQLKDTKSFKTIVDMATLEHNKPMRNMVITAIANCRSPVVVKSLVTLEPKLEASELVEIISGLSINAIPTSELIHELKKVYITISEDIVKEQTLLAIGAQLHELCRPHRVYGKERLVEDSECTEGIKTEFINFFRQEFTRGDEIRKLVLLKSVGNSGINWMTNLESIIKDTGVSMELRVNAIRAMRRVRDVRLVLDTLLPLYRLQATPVELRIEAFNVLLEIEPTEEMLTSLVSHLNMEDNKQLGNYVHSYLQSIIEIPSFFSATGDLSIAAQNLLPTVKHFENNWWYSMNMQSFIEQLGLKVFQHLETRVAINDEQRWPRSIMMKLTRQYCGFFLNDFELGLRMEGLDTLMQELYNKYFTADWWRSSHTSSIHTTNFMRDLSKIHKIITDDEIVTRPTEKTKGTFFWRVLGAEMGVIRLRQETLTEMPTQLWNAVMGINENTRLFSIFSHLPTRMRAHTLMGLPMFGDFSLDMVNSLHIEDSQLERSDLLWSKNVTIRNLIKRRSMFGLTLGPMEVAIGNCEHMKVVLPHTLEVTLDSTNQKVGVEVFLNTQDPMYRSDIADNFHLVEIEQIPVSFFLSIDSEKVDAHLVLEKINLHPLLRTFEQRYQMEMLGLKFTSIQHIDEHTLALPAMPWDGRHIITLSLFDNIVKPLGLKVEVDAKTVMDMMSMTTTTTTQTTKNNDLKINMDIVLHPRVSELTKKLDLVFASNIKEVENRSPINIISLEATPRWVNNGTYRLFIQLKDLMGRRSSGVENLSWLDAGEELPFEQLLMMQYGWNIELDDSKQDFVLKYAEGKTEMHKVFELEDVLFPGSECYKCEQLVSTSGEWRNVHCERCLFKRQTTSRMEYTLFINKQKVGSDLLVKLFEFLDSGNDRFLSHYESNYQENVTPRLVQEYSALVKEHMSELNKVEQLNAFRRVEDWHPYFTERNITTEVVDKHLRFIRVPINPVERRLDNLPLNRLTDIWQQRYDYEMQGICQLDATHTLKTMDDVIFQIPKFDKNCERILAKDCSAKNTFEISVAKTEESSNVVLIKVGDRKVKIVPTKSSFKVTVDSVVVPMEKKSVNEFHYDFFTTEVVEGIVADIRTPAKDTVKSMELFLNDIFTQIVVVEDYVKIMLPFWYKNKICGLCGDFNTEKVSEFKLPNLEVAGDLTSFIEAYSSDKCDNHIR